MQITHKQDQDGHLVQIVTPKKLKEILDENGESYDRPDWFGSEDEWEVETD